jgi:hypothetical protein
VSAHASHAHRAIPLKGRGGNEPTWELEAKLAPKA